MQLSCGDTTYGPAAILDASHGSTDAETQRRGLHLLADAMLAERKRRVEKDLPLVVEAFTKAGASSAPTT
jgi:hypothetical protein